MRVFTGPWKSWPTSAPSAATIGVLDGVHRGHQRLLSRFDEDLVSTVLTFDPHPVEVLRPGTHASLITTLDERIGRLAAAGIDQVGVLDLREIKDQSPEAFVGDVVAGKVNVLQLVVGEDFRFGRGRSGDVATLHSLAGAHGFRVDVIATVVDDGEAISSSRVRRLIQDGAVSEAADLLGARFSITNEVVHGDKRGRELGFPTANLRPPARKLIPARGVYAGLATIGGETFGAAVNVGVRPTFGGEELLIEAFILDFDREIYGSDLTIEFARFLRPELAFETVDALVTRMTEDVMATRDVLEHTVWQT